MPLALLRVVNPSLEVSASWLRFADSACVGRCPPCLSTFVSWDGVLGFGCGTKKGRNRGFGLWPVANSTNAGDLAVSSAEKVYNVVMKQAALIKEQPRLRGDLEVKPEIVVPGSHGALSKAYDRCHEICAEYAKAFYLGTLLLTPEKRKAIWAICVWCQTTDELVDGPNATCITPVALESWEVRLDDIFRGRPFDMLDAVVSDTVTKFPIDIQPFKDMIEGMRMDLRKSRYKNFDELYLYCYHVAGTVGLMTVPVLGIAPDSQTSAESVYNAALFLGIPNQLTNILRDVGEDARRGRIYLPQDELAWAGISEDDIFAGRVTDKWRSFMKSQIRRARTFFNKAERGIAGSPKLTGGRCGCRCCCNVRS